MKTIITKAIKEMLLIRFHYDGGIRVVEPHCFGVSFKGNSVFRGFQTQGYSSTEKLGWKLFDLDKVENVEYLNEKFEEPRLGYRKNDKGMTRIFIQL